MEVKIFTNDIIAKIVKSTDAVTNSDATIAFFKRLYDQKKELHNLKTSTLNHV